MTVMLSIWIVVAIVALVCCQIEATGGEPAGFGWRLIGWAACMVWPVALVPLAAYAYASRPAR